MVVARCRLLRVCRCGLRVVCVLVDVRCWLVPLFVVRCLLCGVCCLLFVVWYVVRGLVSVGYCCLLTFVVPG